MSIEEIEKLANRGEKMPEFSSLADVCLYQALANLYARYRDRKIDIEQASAEKVQIVRAYKLTSTEFKRYSGVYRNYQENIRKSESALNELEKSETTADIVYNALKAIECMTGEKSLINRTLKKFNV